MTQIVDDLIKIVMEDSDVALGCTEPVAVAYCSNVASRNIDKNKIEKINVTVSKNIYKNGKSVKIPNTGDHGLELAAALGAYVKNTSEGFMVFDEVDEEVYKNAKILIDSGKVILNYAKISKDVYVKVEIKTYKDVSIAVIEDSHTHIKESILNGRKLIDNNEQYEATVNTFCMKSLNFKKLREIIETENAKKFHFTLKGIIVNRNAALEGLSGHGLGLGKILNELKLKGVLADNKLTEVRIITAAAADMRMGGGNCPIMTSGGSGNQGIGVILPISIVADFEEVSEDRLAKAIFFAHCINRYVKEYSGKLSGICGCAIGAAIGATAGITWMLGGSDEQISGACSNIYANLTGIICDGAKESCSMKLSTSATESVIAAYLALSGVIVDKNVGVIGENIEDTISNIGKLSTEAFAKVDETMLEIIGESRI